MNHPLLLGFRRIVLVKAHQCLSFSLTGCTMSSSKWPREYERVAPIEEVDQNDYVALNKARNQWVRDR